MPHAYQTGCRNYEGDRPDRAMQTQSRVVAGGSPGGRPPTERWLLICNGPKHYAALADGRCVVVPPIAATLGSANACTVHRRLPASLRFVVLAVSNAAAAAAAAASCAAIFRRPLRRADGRSFISSQSVSRSHSGTLSYSGDVRTSPRRITD